MCEFFFLYISDVQTTTVRESRHCNIMSRDLPGYSLRPVIVGMCNLPYSQIILNDSSLSRLISAAAGAQLSRAAFHAFVCFDESFALLWFHVLLLQTTFWVVVLLNSPSSQSSHSLWEVTLSCFSASEDDCVSHHCANFSSGPSPAKHIPCRQHVSTSSICYFTSCLRPLLNPMLDCVSFYHLIHLIDEAIPLVQLLCTKNIVSWGLTVISLTGGVKWGIRGKGSCPPSWSVTVMGSTTYVDGMVLILHEEFGLHLFVGFWEDVRINYLNFKAKSPFQPLLTGRIQMGCTSPWNLTILMHRTKFDPYRSRSLWGDVLVKC